MSSAEVLTIGESMISLRADSRIRLGSSYSSSLAGSESNVAIGLARLGHKVIWVGAVGSDEQGQMILRTLRAENVSFQGKIDEGSQTGMMMVEHRLGLNPLVSYYRTNSAGSKISFEDTETSITPSLKLLHLSGITPALSDSASGAVARSMARARELGVKISFDLNFRSKLWTRTEASKALIPLAAMADILIASEEELSLLGEESESSTAKKLLAGNCSSVVIKRGARGVTVITKNKQFDVPAHPVTVVDTIGAGDAFCAGYLSATLDNLGVEEAARRGVTAAAFVVSSKGDWEGLPTRKDLEMVALESGEAIR
jgi:2-dehydro-3-deoxygluconokinase